MDRLITLLRAPSVLPSRTELGSVLVETLPLTVDLLVEFRPGPCGPSYSSRVSSSEPEFRARTTERSQPATVPCAAGAWHGRGLACYARSREGMGESGGRKAAYQSYSLELPLASSYTAVAYRSRDVGRAASSRR